MHIAMWNIKGGLRCKLHDLHTYARSFNIDFLFLQETKVWAEEDQALCNVPLLHCLLVTNSNTQAAEGEWRGGVACLIKREWLPFIDVIKSNDARAITIKLNPGSLARGASEVQKILFIHGLYAPMAGDAEQQPFWEAWAEKAQQTHHVVTQVSNMVQNGLNSQSPVVREVVREMWHAGDLKQMLDCWQKAGVTVRKRRKDMHYGRTLWTHVPPSLLPEQWRDIRVTEVTLPTGRLCEIDELNAVLNAHAEWFKNPGLPHNGRVVLSNAFTPAAQGRPATTIVDFYKIWFNGCDRYNQVLVRIKHASKFVKWTQHMFIVILQMADGGCKLMGDLPRW